MENYIKLSIRDTFVVIKFTLDSTQFMFFLFFFSSFFSILITAIWINEMGIDVDNRKISATFKDAKIIIEKSE